MTSKSLFIRILREDIKRRIWGLALFSLMLFIILPVYCALVLQNSSNLIYTNELALLLTYIGPLSTGIIIVVVISAIVCGLSSFYYLNSKKKVDLYHSIPVSREMQFAANYINGLIIFVVPYLVNLFFAMIILKLNDFSLVKIVNIAVAGFVIHILYYCMIYTVTIIAVMLTGNIITSFLGTLVLMGFATIVVEIKNMYYSAFFNTYLDPSSITDQIIVFSPLGCYQKVYMLYANNKEYGITLLVHLIATLILIGIALLLYKKRPSEAAGNPMAFKISKPIIKFLLVVPLSLGCGIILKNTVSYNKDAWLIFGLIFALVVIYAIVQIIFNFDIRSAFHHKRQFLLCALFTFGIVGIFRFDIFRYDAYIPKENSIESMGIHISGIDDNLSYFEFNDEGNRYIDSARYMLNRPIKDNISAAYSLALIAKQNQYVNNTSRTNNLMELPMSYIKGTNMSGNITLYQVKYNLKNGRTVYRQYIFPVEVGREQIKKIYDNKEYKMSHYQIYEKKDRDYNIVEIDSADENLNNMLVKEDVKQTFSLTGEKLQKLLQLYKEELLNLTFDEVSNACPRVRLCFTSQGSEINYYYVYSSFTKTLAYLEESGFDTRKTIQNTKVTSIIISKNSNEFFSENDKIQKPIEPIEVKYTNQEDIKQIMPNLLPTEIYQYNSSIINAIDTLNVNVEYKDGSGNMINTNYVFIKDKIPQRVINDLKAASN